jgi:hypothetical protein
VNEFPAHKRRVTLQKLASPSIHKSAIKRPKREPAGHQRRDLLLHQNLALIQLNQRHFQLQPADPIEPRPCACKNIALVPLDV